MAYITLTLPEGETPINGKLVTFAAPCDCSTPQGVQVGEYTLDLVDAMGTTITGQSGIFCNGAMITVVLDISHSKAYVQNAVDPRAIKNEGNAYSSASTYSVGDYCIYNNQFYKCTTAITTSEAWTAAHWTATNVAAELSDIKSDIISASTIRYNQETDWVQIKDAQGNWHDWARVGLLRTYLYDAGTINTALVGSITKDNYGLYYGSSSTPASSMSITFNASSILLPSSESNNGDVRGTALCGTEEAIDVTNYSKICILASTTYRCNFGVSSTKVANYADFNSPNVLAKTPYFTNATLQTIELDITNVTGNVYPWVDTYSDNGTVTIQQWWLE